MFILILSDIQWNIYQSEKEAYLILLRIENRSFQMKLKILLHFLKL